jgi:hypothetical protein
MAPERPRHGYTMLFGAGIVALIAGGIAFINWTRENPQPPDTGHIPDNAPAANDRGLPPVVEPVEAPPAHAQPADSTEPAAEPSFDPREQPPPDDARELKDRPERKELTAEETREKKQEALALLDRTIERLEKEQAALEKAGDADEAKHVKVRIERMRKLREKRAGELDGGTDGD